MRDPDNRRICALFCFPRSDAALRVIPAEKFFGQFLFATRALAPTDHCDRISKPNGRQRASPLRLWARVAAETVARYDDIAGEGFRPRVGRAARDPCAQKRKERKRKRKGGARNRVKAACLRPNRSSSLVSRESSSVTASRQRLPLVWGRSFGYLPARGFLCDGFHAGS